MGSEKNNIMLIEDDSFIRDIVREILESEGFAVETAENGQIALDRLKLKDRLPDLILLDLMMPVMDGFGFRQGQKTDPELDKIPVIVMSAYRDFSGKQSKIGADGYLKKPVEMDELIEIAHRFCH